MNHKRRINQAELDGVKLTRQEKKSYEYSKQVAHWLVQYDFDYFLTLTFQYAVYDENKAMSAVSNFINCLSASSYGARSKKRVMAFPVIEKGADDSLHIHMMIQNPKPFITSEARRNAFSLRDAVITSWLQASPSAGHPALSATGDDWIKKMDDIREVARYMVKQYQPGASYSSTLLWEYASLDGRKPPH
ncbi:hypothetical protein ELY33_17705 [Vreelandella andesensis]|uniref:Replication-associated protein ORF2/G2P domain-containing protein n=1 Tax=Vreelandella andesensis TaxID=447567 RepID=A0A3S0XVT5_9GAMM|nr:hypothetical protein [Halomonas andesensis]RUR25703.1 hypothetical protein ELY33_17705 [Halomonas andesensis]